MGAAERIGLLLVHGIGEQRRFDHLDGSVRDIVVAMRAAYGDANVTVDVPPASTSSIGAERWSLQTSTKPSVTLHVRRAKDRVEIGVHEVWWADLDEPPSFLKPLRFWFWGLSMWATAARDKHRPAQLPGLQFMVAPKFPTTGPQRNDRFWLRVRLASVGFVFLMLLMSLRLVRVLADRLNIKLLPDLEGVLVDYVDDVRLYRQPRGRYQAPLDDIGQPPRVAIRRRMVDGLVNVALAEPKYDRWYVAAHSLGTVVAFNGLMETGHCLPNYLDKDRWLEVCAAGLGGAARKGDRVGAVHPMMPVRPPWLQPGEVIYRDKLFDRLHGFLTYGSPLDKFAAIWPTIVNLNTDANVLRAGMEWINVYDPTDPVGGALDAFDATAGGKLVPTNHVTAASAWLLYSHIRYLSPAKSGNPLPKRLAHWLADGGAFDAAGQAAWLDAAATGTRRLWSYVQWFLVAATLTVAASVVVGVLLQAAQAWLPDVIREMPWWQLPLWLVAFNIVAVAVIGLLHRMIFPATD